jgi:hypothetical protein
VRIRQRAASSSVVDDVTLATGAPPWATLLLGCRRRRGVRINYAAGATRACARTRRFGEDRSCLQLGALWALGKLALLRRS